MYNKIKENLTLLSTLISLVTVVVVLTAFEVKQSEQLRTVSEQTYKNTLFIEKLSDEKVDKDVYFKDVQNINGNIDYILSKTDEIQRKI